eukprot:10581907-Alexandrium_andersonii.AAC.1
MALLREGASRTCSSVQPRASWLSRTAAATLRRELMCSAWGRAPPTPKPQPPARVERAASHRCLQS